MADLFNSTKNFPIPKIEGCCVPWMKLTAIQFNPRKDYILPEIQAHMEKLVHLKGNEHGIDYFKYLTGHCGFELKKHDFSGILRFDIEK